MTKRILNRMIAREIRRVIALKTDAMQNLMDYGIKYKESLGYAQRDIGIKVLELKIEILKALRGKKEKQ